MATQNNERGLYARRSDIEYCLQRGYNLGRKIGSGSFATVITAQYVVQSDKRANLACKVIDRSKTPPDIVEKFLPRELEILTKIEHPYIVKIHRIFERGPKVFIFMSYAENGDLLHYINSHGPISELKTKVWFSQMVRALGYLHSKEIAHRDLKCENILISNHMNIKLADFGVARYCSDGAGNRVLSQTYCGTLAYMAPEVIKQIPYDPKIADVWSLGIILFVMLNAKKPFDDSSLCLLIDGQRNKRFDFRPTIIISRKARLMVRALLMSEPRFRLNLNMVLNSSWLAENGNET